VCRIERTPNKGSLEFSQAKRFPSLRSLWNFQGFEVRNSRFCRLISRNFIGRENARARSAHAPLSQSRGIGTILAGLGGVAGSLLALFRLCTASLDRA